MRLRIEVQVYVFLNNLGEIKYRAKALDFLSFLLGNVEIRGVSLGMGI
jgi:hypothetical protein